MAVATPGILIGGLDPGNAVFVAALTGAILLVMAALALMAHSDRAQNHLNAGEDQSPIANGLAIAGLFALPATVLLPGLVYQNGFDGLIPLIGIPAGLIVLMGLVGPALSRAGVATLPELIGLRFGRLGRTVTLLIAVLSTLGLLLGTMSAGISLAARIFDRPVAEAALVMVALLLLIILPGGLRSTVRIGMLGFVLSAATVIGGLAIVSFWLLGNPIPQLAYGAALKEIAPAEISLIEAGLVDFGVFKPFLREFLTVDSLNWMLLTFALMAGIAALPPLVHATRAVRRPSDVRRGLAWALTFCVLLLTAIPGLAAIARLEVYKVVAAQPDLSDLPTWMQRASESDALRVHGASLGMADDAARAVMSGVSDPGGLTAAMSARGYAQEQVWQRLDPVVQEAVFAAALDDAAAPSRSLDARWRIFAQRVLTAAAQSAGNPTGKPDLAAISLDLQTLVVALPHAAGMAPAVIALTLAAVLGAALALAAALISSIAGMLAHDGAGAVGGAALADRDHVTATRVFSVGLTVLAAAAVVFVPMPPDVVVVASLTLAAAGLMPALLLAIWWPRATAWGWAAGLAAGLGIGAYYLIGTALFSVTFYEQWFALSNAGPEAWTDFEEAKALWLAAEGDDRAAAYADLAARTSGGLWSPGLANWFGVAPAAAAVLAIPVALFAAILVSLLTPKPGPVTEGLFQSMHGWRPADGLNRRDGP